MSERTIEVPEGCKAILVTDQLLAHYADWQRIDNVEARAVSLRGGPMEASDLLVDVQTRYIVVPPVSEMKYVPRGQGSA